MEAPGTPPSRSVLAVFGERDDPVEPLTAPDVAERVGCTDTEARERLDALAERGSLESKRIGDRTVWWRPPSATTARPASADDSSGGHRVPSLSDDHSGPIERVLEASPVSIVVVEPSGEISFANRRAAETLGLEREEIASRTYSQPEWDIHYHDGRPVPVEEHPVTRVLETGEPDYGFEHWITLPDGSERWLSSNSAPVLNDDGEVEYVVVGFEDATPMKEREDKLTSDRRRVVELRSEQLTTPFLDAADDDVRVDVEDVMTSPDGTVLQYVAATGISPRALTDVFERQFGARNVRLLRSTGDRCRLAVQTDERTLPKLFADLGGEVDSLVRCRENREAVLTGVLPGDVEPRTVLRRARERYADVELVSQELRYTPRLLYDVVEDVLTERQFAALRTAYYGGYFDTPRASTGDELADQLGVTRQTFNQHLRKGERAVLERLFEASGKGGR
ncbi:PAS domain S-box-containing protein [Halogeometricum rufum]|uniref:PAS domain S-box-containing protein n=1 Tax=Halogeometricum rufum TaxID=553469 RepID=A0A1I6G8C0_9EURY|nr:bacterio-opsin activator domain-containing protein [Halogeometricum rufum]SFR38390.1 PAS domain S-box-containing protein [Halogeometricum rufum]